jgi:dynein heavy chain 2
VRTTLVGTILNGLSHLHGVKDRSHFGVGLIRGLGGNVKEESLNEFAKFVFQMIGTSPPDSDLAYNVTYDAKAQCLRAYRNEVSWLLKSNFDSINYCRKCKDLQIFFLLLRLGH